MKFFFIISLAGIIILVGGIMIFSENDNKANEAKGINAQSGQNKIKTIVGGNQNQGGKQAKNQTKSDSRASVTVEVTPKTLGAGNEKNIFEVSLNTHSVELGYDFVEIIKLEDDLGNSYGALEWTGGSGGHHLDGEIIFGPIDKQAKEVKMTITGVGGINRLFEWSL